jgi:hypothetical protein
VRTRHTLEIAPRIVVGFVSLCCSDLVSSPHALASNNSQLLLLYSYILVLVLFWGEESFGNHSRAVHCVHIDCASEENDVLRRRTRGLVRIIRVNVLLTS